MAYIRQQVHVLFCRNKLAFSSYHFTTGTAPRHFCVELRHVQIRPFWAARKNFNALAAHKEEPICTGNPKRHVADSGDFEPAHGKSEEQQLPYLLPTYRTSPVWLPLLLSKPR